MTRTSRRTFLERSLIATAVVPLGLANKRGLRRDRRPGERIRIGVIGVRGRGRAHVGAFKGSPDSEVVAVCDVDEGVVGPALKSVPEARFYKDLRALLDDDTIDAVSIATPNHWHSLAAIWALEAGKHVYVEKPASHNVFEGRQLVLAARRAGKIVQHGTQARSQPATQKALEWLHSGGLGEVKLATGLCYKLRPSIGKVVEAQQPPATCDYDLWSGPAPLAPLMRSNLHYDWHWDFATGNGDIGNQGVHQLDIARWGLELQGHPQRVTSYGGRLGYVDDGNTPNTQVALFDYGDKQIVFEVRGLSTPTYRDTSIGVIFHGEGGYLVSGSYGKVLAYDHDGKELASFEGGASHFQNFLDAVKADDVSLLNAPIEAGHVSSALSHLGNTSYRLGRELALADLPDALGEVGDKALGRLREHLASNGLDLKATPVRLGPTLTFDGARERFTGERADEANRLLTREYRAPFVVRERT